ncbi:hypothetical protein [Nocardioides sp.]|uniref:hypothetical protein n=1 Tax=Nocardioides sp. TaxID=35761 RepID=UPI0039E5839B
MSDEFETASETTGRHPVNVGHLVMGLAFLCFVGGWALIEGDLVTGDDIRWLLPIPWLVAGAVGLIAIAISSTRKHGTKLVASAPPDRRIDASRHQLPHRGESETR